MNLINYFLHWNTPTIGFLSSTLKTSFVLSFFVLYNLTTLFFCANNIWVFSGLIQHIEVIDEPTSVSHVSFKFLISFNFLASFESLFWEFVVHSKIENRHSEISKRMCHNLKKWENKIKIKLETRSRKNKNCRK